VASKARLGRPAHLGDGPLPDVRMPMAVDTLHPDIAARPGAPPPSRRSWSGRLSERLRLVPVNGWTVGLVVLALTVVSLALRVGRIGFHFWIDEAISVGIASHPLGQLPTLLRQDGSPPLYYALLHVWMSVFGRGEAATHTLSLLFALATVPAAYWGGASLFGRRVGIYAAVLAAGLPFLTSYAQETRMYSLLALLSLLAGAAFVHGFVYRRWRYLPLLALSLTAALYTHNWALFLGLAVLIAFLVCVWWSPGARRELWRDGALVAGAVALMFLPWLPTLVYQAQHTGAPWALAPVVWSLTTAGYFLVGGRGAAVALLLAGGAGLTRLCAVADLGHRRERDALRAAVVLGILGAGTLLIAWAYAKATPAWSGRYFGVIVGPLLLVFALGLARARGLGIAALALVCCFWVLDPQPASLDAKSNVASVAAAVRSDIRPTTLVLSTQPEQVPALAYYLRQARDFATPLGPVPDPRVMDWRGALGRFERSSVAGVLAPLVGAVAPRGRVLLVVPIAFQKTPRWMALIHKASRGWLRYLRHDRRLRLLHVAEPHAHGTNLPVEGWLFAVR
jgi:mannosyltransferase